MNTKLGKKVKQALVTHFRTIQNNGQKIELLMHSRPTAGEDSDFKVDKYVLESISEDIDISGKVSNAVFENMMRNNSVKADVLRELASQSLDKEDEGTATGTGTQYSGNTFVHRDTMTGAHSSGTILARADAKINKSNKYTSQSGDSPPELTSG